MKISQIVSEERVDEAPVGMFKQGLKKVGAKVAQKVGMKNTAMGLAGQVDTGDEANKLRSEFQNYIGSTGQSMGKIDAGDLAAWLKSKKYPTNNVPTSGVLNKKMLDNILLKTVQDSKKVGGGSGTTAQPSAGADAGASTQATQGADAPNNAKQGTTDTAGTDKATATGSSADGAGKAPPTGNGSAAGAATEIPPNIQAQLDLLNDPDKKRLASML